MININEFEFLMNFVSLFGVLMVILLSLVTGNGKIVLFLISASGLLSANAEFLSENPKTYEYIIPGKPKQFVAYTGNCSLGSYPVIMPGMVVGLPKCCLSDSDKALAFPEWEKVVNSCNLELGHLLTGVHVTNSQGVDTAIVDTPAELSFEQTYNKIVEDFVVKQLSYIDLRTSLRIVFIVITIPVTLFLLYVVCLLLTYPFKFVTYVSRNTRRRWVDWWSFDRKKFKSFTLKSQVERLISPIAYDEHGPYVSYKNVRIYTQKEQELTTLDGFQGDVSIPLYPQLNKETRLAHTSMYDAELPKYVGCLAVSGNVVGMFTRVLFDGKDAFLTASHVMNTHRLNNLALVSGSKSYDVDPSWKVLAYSKETELDFIIIQAPIQVFSRLEMKIAKIATNVPMSVCVNLYGLEDTSIKRSSGVMQIASQGKFYVKYGASTLPSWSGTPLISKAGVLGIHTTGGCEYNLGSLLPCFQTNKETGAFGSMYVQDEYDEDKYERYLNRKERREIEDREAYEEFADRMGGEQTFISSRDNEYVETKMAFKNKSYIQRSHSYREPSLQAWADLVDYEEDMSLDAYSKETSVMCNNCHLVQSKNKHCKQCNFLLLNVTPAEKTKLTTPQYARMGPEVQLQYQNSRHNYAKALDDTGFPEVVTRQVLDILKPHFEQMAEVKAMVLDIANHSKYQMNLKHNAPLEQSVPGIKIESGLKPQAPKPQAPKAPVAPSAPPAPKAEAPAATAKKAEAPTTAVKKYRCGPRGCNDPSHCSEFGRTCPPFRKETSTVPLNSERPADGAGSSGTTITLNSAQASAILSQMLAGQTAPSAKRQRRRNRTSGKNSPPVAPKPASTTGPIVVAPQN